MNLQEAVRSVLSKYADFTGRARRSEFWFWYLAVFIASVVSQIIDSITGVPLISAIVGLGIIVPTLAVGVRRLHDISKSGWLILLFLIPIVNIVLLIVWFAMEDSHADNEYGPNPKGAGGPPMPPAYGTPPPPPGY